MEVYAFNTNHIGVYGRRILSSRQKDTVLKQNNIINPNKHFIAFLFLGRMFVISPCVFCGYYIHIDIGCGIELAEITSMNHLYLLICIDVQLSTNVSGLSLNEDIDMS